MRFSHVECQAFPQPHPSMKEGSLFILYLWDPPNWDALDCILGPFWKLLKRNGALACFHGILIYSEEILEYAMISSLRIKFNQSWKFWKYWNVPLVLLERFGWTRFNGIYLVRFGFRMREILILKWFLPLKIQINSQKLGFGRKNQLRTW
jgi:hypothetical protein